MTLGHKKSKVTDFFKKNVGLDSSPLISVLFKLIPYQVYHQTSKLFMFSSILSNWRRSTKYHRVMNTTEGNNLKNNLCYTHGTKAFFDWSLKRGILTLSVTIACISFIHHILYCLWHFGDCLMKKNAVKHSM